MTKLILALYLSLHLLMPLAAIAQAALKTPLSYSLQEYGIVPASALLDCFDPSGRHCK